MADVVVIESRVVRSTRLLDWRFLDNLARMTALKDRRLVPLVLLAAFLVAGCTNPDRYYESLYEGLKSREENANPSMVRATPGDSVPYKQYDEQRRRHLNSEASQRTGDPE